MTSHHPTGPDFQRDTGLSQPNPAALVAEALPRTVQNSWQQDQGGFDEIQKDIPGAKSEEERGFAFGFVLGDGMGNLSLLKDQTRL